MTQGTAEQIMLRRTSVTIKPTVLKSEFACCAYLITVQANLWGSDRAMTGLQKVLLLWGHSCANSLFNTHVWPPLLLSGAMDAMH